MAVRRWIWVVIGLFAFAGISCVGMIGAGAWFISRHVEVRELPSREIEAEFAQMRARFRGQKPLLETRRDLAVASDRLAARASTYSGPLPTALCILAWEDGDPRRARICVPFWLLKLKTGKGLKVGVPEAGIERIEISAEDLERAGPALLLDLTEGRDRVLVWTE